MLIIFGVNCTGTHIATPLHAQSALNFRASPNDAKMRNNVRGAVPPMDATTKTGPAIDCIPNRF